jgi:hypothetical protein
MYIRDYFYSMSKQEFLDGVEKFKGAIKPNVLSVNWFRKLLPSELDEENKSLLPNNLRYPLRSWLMNPENSEFKGDIFAEVIHNLCSLVTKYDSASPKSKIRCYRCVGLRPERTSKLSKIELVNRLLEEVEWEEGGMFWSDVLKDAYCFWASYLDLKFTLSASVPIQNINWLQTSVTRWVMNDVHTEIDILPGSSLKVDKIFFKRTEYTCSHCDLII